MANKIEISQYYEMLAPKLKNGDLAAFIGAGVSRTYTDPRTGKQYQGLLGASEIVEKLSQQKSYLSSDLSFEQAFFLLKSKEGRTQLERVIQEYIDKQGLPPLPAHDLLANMPFSVLFTTNYDTLMERALANHKKPYIQIIEEDDVSRWHGNQLPLVKIHGCVTRPQTIVAAEDEYLSLNVKAPIIEALIKTLLSNKTVLFIGFSLRDPDFKSLYDELVHILGDHMPKSYAVVHNPTNYESVYWNSRGVELIQFDLTDFLRGLLRSTIKQDKPSVYHGNDDWMNNSYFQALLDIRTSPSETQAIDAFLEHLSSEATSSTLSCEDILDGASMAVETIINCKPNFEAFRKMWTELKTSLDESAACGNDEMEDCINQYITNRKNASQAINRKWKNAIQKGDNILVFSQSIRMLDMLKAVPRGIQETCKIYICECRPKSPAPFQDAYALCESLKDTKYEMTIIPDVCLGNLIERQQITKIVLGAHSIFYRQGKPISFVNTCGSLMITLVAKFYSIPTFIVAESAKNITLDETSEPKVSYMEEENIFTSEEMTARLQADNLQKISKLNVGYDLCKIHENVTIISEVD